LDKDIWGREIGSHKKIPGDKRLERRTGINLEDEKSLSLKTPLID